MIEKPMISIDGINREMSDQEFKQFQLDVLEIEKLKEQELAKAAARTSALAKLAALGLTEAEVAAL
jgi:hypothetical protein